MRITKVETSILFKFLYFVFPFGLVIYKLILCIDTHIAHVVGISFSIKYAHTSTMKKIGFAIIGTLTLVFVIVLLSIYPHEPEESRYIRVNDGIFLSEEYNVADSFTGSSITGTILASKDDNDTITTLIGHVNITDKDVGPVYIFFPNDLQMNDVVSGFKLNDYPQHLLNPLCSRDKEGTHMIIGAYHSASSFGGTGDFVAYLSLNPDHTSLSKIPIVFQLGSKIQDDGSVYSYLTKKEIIIEI